MQRRDFLKATGFGVIGMTLGGISLRAAAQEQLSTDDPTAKALNYVHASEKPDAVCGNCMYVQGEAGAEWRPCALFPSKLVNAKGWCSAWVKKPG